MKLARFLWPYRLRIGVALAALLVTSACVLVLGRGLQYVVDRGFGSGEPRLLDEALLAMIGVVVAFALMPQQYKTRYSTITHSELDGSSKSRLVTWVAGLNMLIDRPLFGVGIHANIVTASLLAVLSAANRALRRGAIGADGELARTGS